MDNIMKFTINHNGENELINQLTNVIQSAVEQNAELVAFTIDQGIESAEYILDCYIDHLLALMLRDYDSERLLDLIKSSTLFTLRSVLEDELYNNHLIQKSLKEIAV